MQDLKLDISGTSNRIIHISLGIIVLFLIVWILILGRTIILPFMIALFLSFILDPIVSLLTRIKVPLGIAVLLTLILAFVVLYLLGVLIYANVQSFVGQFPVYEERLKDWVTGVSSQLEVWIGEPLTGQAWKRIDWFDAFQQFSVARGLLSSVGSFFSFFLKMLIVIIFIAYLLTGKRNINTKIARAFPHERADQIVALLNNITGQVQTYLGAKTIISLITGLISIAIFLFFGLDFAIFWGLLIFVFNYIPNIGSFMASALPVVFSLLQYGSLTRAFWLMLCLTILQFAMGNIFEPRLMGRSLNLSPLIVIMSLIFWGYIWGVAGMILAVPILATMTIVFENIPALRFLSVFFRGK